MSQRIVMALCVLGLAGLAVAESGNRIVNGGFEEGQTGWRWDVWNHAQASGKVDATVSHTGRSSYRITNASPLAPYVYGQASQIVVGLKPETAYVVGAWGKGRAAHWTRLQAGPNWKLTQPLPEGDSDWTWLAGVYTTDKDQTTLPVMLHTEDVTDAAWFDDVEVVELSDWKKSARLFARSETSPLVSEDRLYPAPHTDQAETAPLLSVRDETDAALGFDVRIFWNERALVFNIDVQDPTNESPKTGSELWAGDSVQIGIDTNPDTPNTDSGYTNTSFELGFSTVASDGKVNTFDWQPGNMNWTGVKTEGKRTETGYQLHISIPWANLGLDAANLPRWLGVNVLVNDYSQGRRMVSWTPGIGDEKNPNKYAQVMLLLKDRSVDSVGRFRLTKPVGTMYDGQDDIVGRYVEYAITATPDTEVGLVAVDEKGQKQSLGKATLPAVASGKVRRMDFIVPAAILAEEGRYRFEVEPTTDARQVARMKPLRRLNVTSRVTTKMADVIKRVETLTKTLKDEPQLAGDAYVQMGLPVAQFYIKHIQAGGWPGVQTPAWDLMQLEEIEQILDQTDARIARLRKGEVKPYQRREIQPGSVRIRDGKFYAKPVGSDVEQVFYLGGYGAWDRVLVDIETLHATGMNITQQSASPAMMLPDGTAKHLGIPSESGTRLYSEMLDVAKQNHVCVDWMLAPHDTPAWLREQSPEIFPEKPCGFIQYNIDHPIARKFLLQYLDQFLPAVKDQPATLSICLSNESTYSGSGRDQHSRPAWIAFLQEQHKTIDALNALYDTKYKDFESVPVPEMVETFGEWDKLTLGQKRVYYDWSIFNQKNFTDWHVWLREEIHKRAPGIPIHAKIMPKVFEFTPFQWGVDPERFTRAMDIAGNDSFGVWSWTPGGQYAYDWAPEEAWYELLYSLGGKPVYNSENHLVNADLPPIHIPTGHTHSGTWLSALHHCWASAMWVWEVFPPYEPSTVYRRPANVHAMGKAMVDLDRLIGEAAAITDAPDEIAILYSMPSVLWQDDYSTLMPELFEAVSLLGKPVRFISEQQLAEGAVPESLKWIIIPHATHVKQPAVDALAKFAQAGGHVAKIGKGCLAWDEYHRPRELPETLKQQPMIQLAKESKTIADALREAMAKQGMEFLPLIDLATGKPVWGVEYQAVEYNGSMIISMVNLLNQPLTVRLDIKGKAYDLLAEEDVDMTNIVLAPMAPKLLRITKD